MRSTSKATVKCGNSAIIADINASEQQRASCCGIAMIIATGTHSVSMQCGSDQPAAVGAAEVVAADVEAFDVRGMADDARHVNCVVGRDGVVADVDVGDVGVCDDCGSGPFQARLVDALERKLRERSVAQGGQNAV